MGRRDELEHSFCPSAGNASTSWNVSTWRSGKTSRCTSAWSDVADRDESLGGRRRGRRRGRAGRTGEAAAKTPAWSPPLRERAPALRRPVDEPGVVVAEAAAGPVDQHDGPPARPSPPSAPGTLRPTTASGGRPGRASPRRGSPECGCGRSAAASTGKTCTFEILAARDRAATVRSKAGLRPRWGNRR